MKIQVLCYQERKVPVWQDLGKLCDPIQVFAELAQTFFGEPGMIGFFSNKLNLEQNQKLNRENKWLYMNPKVVPTVMNIVHIVCE